MKARLAVAALATMTMLPLAACSYANAEQSALDGMCGFVVDSATGKHQQDITATLAKKVADNYADSSDPKLQQLSALTKQAVAGTNKSGAELRQELSGKCSQSVLDELPK